MEKYLKVYVAIKSKPERNLVMGNPDAVFRSPCKSQYPMPSLTPHKNVLCFKEERGLFDIMFIPLDIERNWQSEFV